MDVTSPHEGETLGSDNGVNIDAEKTYLHHRTVYDFMTFSMTYAPFQMPSIAYFCCKDFYHGLYIFDVYIIYRI